MLGWAASEVSVSPHPGPFLLGPARLLSAAGLSSAGLSSAGLSSGGEWWGLSLWMNKAADSLDLQGRWQRVSLHSQPVLAGSSEGPREVPEEDC